MVDWDNGITQIVNKNAIANRTDGSGVDTSDPEEDVPQQAEVVQSDNKDLEIGSSSDEQTWVVNKILPLSSQMIYQEPLPNFDVSKAQGPNMKILIILSWSKIDKRLRQVSHLINVASIEPMHAGRPS